MGYADLPTAKADLGITDASQDARLAALDDALTRQFDARIGAPSSPWFGGSAAAETEVIAAPGVSTILVLPRGGLRSLTSVVDASAATWNGAAWTGGTTLASTLYRLIYRDGGGDSLAIERVDGAYWSGRLLVTGIWADQIGVAVPADVKEALTYLVVSFFLRRKESPEGFVGPEGLTVPRRFDPWKDSRVYPVVDRYRLTPVVV